MARKKWKDHPASDHDSYNCELQENVAYVSAAHNKLSSDACCEEEEKGVCEEENMTVNGKDADLKPASQKLPCRQYLKEKQVYRVQTNMPRKYS